MTAPLALERLKQGLAFGLFTATGDVDGEHGPGGIYCRDTRVVDRYRARLAGRALEWVGNENLDDRLIVRLRLRTAHGEWAFVRTLRLTEVGLSDHWHWRAPPGAQALRLRFEIGTRFRDIFEVRGLRRARRGRLERAADGRAVRYRGLDRRLYSLRLSGRRLGDAGPARTVALPGAARRRQGTFTVRMSWRTGGARRGERADGADLQLPQLQSNDVTWDAVWARSARDLRMLAADLGHGPVLLAGLPWFASLFGRDAILSALLLLPLAPDVGRATVETLAALQGTRTDPWREEAPGKILHERRLGEMARTGEVPFGRYYGAVDGTALFVTLLVRTWRALADDGWLARNEAALRAALRWIDASARADPALGLFRFAPSAPGGLVVQSWKDSADSMVHADGSLAPPPLAVAEVQGYVYQAMRAGALALSALGDWEAALRLRRQARDLRARFHRAFWLGPERGYAMAVDGRDRALAVVSSDPGQCLWSGIVPPAWRRAVSARLMAPDLFSGWGLRTLASSAAAFDPLGYHRGGVWPHDTALAAIGMYAAGEARDGERLARALIEAGAALPGGHLPELFSGAERVPGQPPEPYARACVPQAWAAAAPFGCLAAMLHVRVDRRRRLVRVDPRLGAGLSDVCLGPIAVPGGALVVRVAAGGAALEQAPPGWRIAVVRRVPGIGGA